MKISEVGVQTVKDWCGISGDDSDAVIEALIPAALSYLCSTTGHTAGALDEMPDMTAAFLVLINDMFYNRTYAADESSVNPIVKCIIGLHDKNFLA